MTMSIHLTEFRKELEDRIGECFAVASVEKRSEDQHYIDVEFFTDTGAAIDAFMSLNATAKALLYRHNGTLYILNPMGFEHLLESVKWAAIP